MPACFVARLRKLADSMSFHWQVRSWDLHKRGGDCGHDESKKQRVSLLSTRMNVCHERGLVYAWRQRIDKVEEQGNDKEHGVSRGYILEPMGPVIIRKRGYRGRRGYGELLVLLV
jgi:hypothetical protein